MQFAGPNLCKLCWAVDWINLSFSPQYAHIFVFSTAYIVLAAEWWETMCQCVSPEGVRAVRLTNTHTHTERTNYKQCLSFRV